jgi:branched-chain amino acid transport system permease protein
VVDTPWNVWLTFLIAGLIAALVAFLVGMAVLHLRMAFFFMVSMALAEFFRSIWLHMDYPFGSAYGIRGIPSPEGFTYAGRLYQSFFYLILAFAVLTFIICYRMTRGRYGLLTRATGQIPELCSSIGAYNRLYRVQTFVVSSFLAAVAGAILGSYTTFVSPVSYTFFTSLDIMIFTLVGGVGSIWGPIVGAVLLRTLYELLVASSEHRLIIFGVVLIIVAIFLPGGLISIRIPRFLRREKIEGGLDGHT